MKNLVDHVKANKALYIKRTLIVLATGATIAVVAYAVKNGGDDSIEEIAELTEALAVADAA